jgi:hypothetical protein
MSSRPFTNETTTRLGFRLWWAIPAMALVLLVMVANTFGGRGRSEKIGYGTTYDASEAGLRGVYLLLEELHFPVERSRRPTGGDIRWVLFPEKSSSQEAKALDDWVQHGGCALLALENAEYADQMGFSVTATGNENTLIGNDDEPFTDRSKRHVGKGKSHTATAPDVAKVFAGRLSVKGPAGGQAWGQIDGQPLVTIYKRGRGELWLLNRPDVFVNSNLRKGDNAVLACRLADAMLAKRPGGRLSFDEYCHGFHERPNIFELLFTFPVLPATLEAVFLTLLAVWHFGARFGSVRPAPPPPRRSKEEFLDAMAELLTRKGDREEAFRTVRNEFLRRLEELLGLPAGTPVEETVREASERRGVKMKPLLRLLTATSPPEGRGVAAFLNALQQLEDAENECFKS